MPQVVEFRAELDALPEPERTNGRGFLGAGGSHSLQHLVNQVADGVTDPETHVSVAERLRAKMLVDGNGKNATPEAKEFLKAFKAKYNTVPVSVWAVLAGDAFKVIEGALAAGNDKPEAIAAWLKNLKDMPGLSGSLGFNAKGDRVGEFYRIYTVNNKGVFILQPK